MIPIDLLGHGTANAPHDPAAYAHLESSIESALPDDPGYPGLTVSSSYFDRTPYVEQEARATTYVEHHRTLGARVREITAAGLARADLVEPAWPEATQQVWRGGSPGPGAPSPDTALCAGDARRASR